MQLDALKTIALGFIRDKNDSPLNPSNYTNKSSIDLTIGEVIYKDKKGNIRPGVGTSLKPQQSMLIISEEIIRVPDDHVAYVFLKNRLSQRGLLALNTGIIDSGYIGPISSLVINFSNVNAEIPSGRSTAEKEFFRVVFHKIDSSASQTSPIQVSTSYTASEYSDYKQKAIKNLENLPKTFLEPTYLKEQIRNEIFDKMSELSLFKLGFMITVIGLIFTLFSVGKDYFFGMQYDLKDTISNQAKYELQIENLNSDVDKLNARIRALELAPNNGDNGS